MEPIIIELIADDGSKEIFDEFAEKLTVKEFRERYPHLEYKVRWYSDDMDLLFVEETERRECLTKATYSTASVTFPGIVDEILRQKMPIMLKVSTRYVEPGDFIHVGEILIPLNELINR